MINKFAEHVRVGLSSEKKRLSSIYFYDDKGSQIFKEIMAMPEYYLTDAEFEILQRQPAEIIEAVGFKEPFNIIELGAGDGSKTIELLRYCIDQELDVSYTPVDISNEVTRELVKQLSEDLPSLAVTPLIGDYFQVLPEVEKEHKPHLFLFLGSNIGNYKEEEASELIGLFANNMHPNDKLLIGFDLQKNPDLIAKAYNDPAGITRSFNLNLLSRINHELGGDFNLQAFDFYAFYNAETGENKSFLVSLEDQNVHIEALKQDFHFAKNELIYTELSKKYTLNQIEALGHNNMLATKGHFLDQNKYFSDSLFEK